MMSNTRGYNRRGGNCGCTDMYREDPRRTCVNAPRITGTKTGSRMLDRNTAEACQLQKEMMSLYFVMIELELYLDGHPNSTEALKRYRCTVEEFNETAARYEAVFGPLMARNSDCENEWRWATTPWPWEV